METAYNNKTRCRLETTRQTDVILVAVIQNLKTHFKVLTFEGGDLLGNSGSTKELSIQDTESLINCSRK